MEEMHCPLCGRVVRSDATLRRVCMMCGMGIGPDATAYVVEVPGRRLTFCSFDCLVAHREVVPSGG
jgi:hypothetical protein